MVAKISDIERIASSCVMCAYWCTSPAEPLLPSPLPDLPWQKVATNLFEYDKKHYLIMMDYFSHYIELVELCSETTKHAIVALESIFTCHGIPAMYIVIMALLCGYFFQAICNSKQLSIYHQQPSLPSSQWCG